MSAFDAEWYLRRLAEDTLLGLVSDDRGEFANLKHATAALVAVGAIEPAVASAVVGDYGIAQAAREERVEFTLRRREFGERAASLRPPPGRRVVGLADQIELPRGDAAAPICDPRRESHRGLGRVQAARRQEALRSRVAGQAVRTTAHALQRGARRRPGQRGVARVLGQRRRLHALGVDAHRRPAARDRHDLAGAGRPAHSAARPSVRVDRPESNPSARPVLRIAISGGRSR